MRRRRGHDELEDLTDEALLGLSGRRPDAFAVFYRRHVSAVLRYFARRVACRETTADLAAETFAQAYLSLRRYRRTDAPAQAWLMAIARHQLNHFIRSAAVARRARRRLGMRDVPVGDEVSEVVETVDARRNGTALWGAVDGLPEAIGAAVRLRVLDGLSYAEIAPRLGCSEAAARQRVARGLAHIAGQLEEGT